MKLLKKFVLAILITIVALVVVPKIMPEWQNTVSAASIKLNKREKTIYEGNTYKLKVIGTNKKVTWSSSNKKVATVNSKGKVTAKYNGTATIIAKVGSKKLNCKINVKLVQFSTKFYEIDNVAKKTISFEKVNNTKTVKYDLDKDGKKDEITIKRNKYYDKEMKEYYTSGYDILLNGKKFANYYPFNVDKLYIADLDKSDKKNEIIVLHYEETDFTHYTIYSKINNKMKKIYSITEQDGGKLRIDEKGKFLFANSLTDRITPRIYNKYYTIKNDKVSMKQNDVNKIKNITFKGKWLSYSKSKKANDDEKLVKNLNSNETFNIIKFIKSKNNSDNAAYVKLKNGKKVYIFTEYYW